MTKGEGRFGLLALLCLSLVACTSSRYSMKHDAAPTGDFDALAVPDAVPVWEPMSPRGNTSPYVVRGKQYKVMSNASGYSEEGIASWYGLKFHGELTSNGEIYNMYEMSAAHKTLPLPTYVRVTNLKNQRSTIVRVNDRGPFHEGRIIDLSYAAAKKLGFSDLGTAPVRVEAIDMASQRSASADSMPETLSNFIQVAAFSQLEAAEKTKRQLDTMVSAFPIFIARSPDRNPPVFRVRVGPIDSEQEAERVLKQIQDSGYQQAIVISRSVRARES